VQVFALATRSALAPFAAHSALWSLPAQLQGQRARGWPTILRGATPMRPLKHARNCCEQARH
jgi:hypothetical protein